MKKKLLLKKVTIRDLDESRLETMAGRGGTQTTLLNNTLTCPGAQGADCPPPNPPPPPGPDTTPATCPCC